MTDRAEIVIVPSGSVPVTVERLDPGTASFHTAETGGSVVTFPQTIAARTSYYVEVDPNSATPYRVDVRGRYRVTGGASPVEFAIGDGAPPEVAVSTAGGGGGGGGAPAIGVGDTYEAARFGTPDATTGSFDFAVNGFTTGDGGSIVLDDSPAWADPDTGSYGYPLPMVTADGLYGVEAACFSPGPGADAGAQVDVSASLLVGPDGNSGPNVDTATAASYGASAHARFYRVFRASAGDHFEGSYSISNDGVASYRTLRIERLA